MFKLCLVLVTLAIIGQAYSESVPAIIIGKKSPTFLPALKHVSGDEFVTLVKSQADKDTLTVVFVENNLSVEDLSQCKLNTKTCFENLRNTDKTYFSSVEHPVDSLISAFGNKKSISVSRDNDLKDVNVDGEKILFVYLDDVEQPEDFSKHDELMDKIVKELQTKYGDVIAIYTGIHPSFKYSEPLKRHVREAEPADGEPKPAETPAEPPKEKPVPHDESAVPEDVHVFTNEQHVLVALKQMRIRNRKTQDPIVEVNPSSLTLAVSNVTGSPVNSFVATLSGSGHKLEMLVEISGGTWEALFRYNDNDESKEKFHTRTAVVGYGEGYGFGCTDLYIESFDREIRLLGFQFEPQFEPTSETNLDSRKFSNRVSDCVGYFTPGIWAALFIVILFMFIMTYGISMMLDIRTMDKFDDPKGKTITVSAAE